jgi:CRISPR-associated exonuclease Cas4
MYDEDDLLPLSGLQHLTYCERRWALVHIELAWADNQYTAEGAIGHERAHSAEPESRPNCLIRRTLPLRSLKLGLSGQADVVEFHRVAVGEAGITLAGRSGKWRPHPVEYKRGKARGVDSPYHVQLCAQAICLEEMLGTPVSSGALYDAKGQRRTAVEFSGELRQQVETAAARMHELHRAGFTPPGVWGPKCEKCSLLPICEPRWTLRYPEVSAYLAEGMAGLEE